MIISASRRTDIPRFYSQWLLGEIKKEQFVSENPFNPDQKKIIPLSEVHQFVFWTRLARDMSPVLDILDSRGIAWYFLYTITGYPRWLEENSPGDSAIDNFVSLSARTGKTGIIWRYDPIVFSTELNSEYHINRFGELCEKLSACTGKVIVSLYDDSYPSARKRMNLQAGKIGKYLHNDPARLTELFFGLQKTAASYSLSVQTCADSRITAHSGIPAGPCIEDRKSSSQLTLFSSTPAESRDKGQRPQCLCAKSTDIGRYNTCRGGCLYCYGTKSKKIGDMI